MLKKAKGNDLCDLTSEKLESEPTSKIGIDEV